MSANQRKNSVLLCLLACAATLLATPAALAVDGPNRRNITNARRGRPPDPFPFVPILDFDYNNNGFFVDSIIMAANNREVGNCTGTLLSSNVVVSAGHCLVPNPATGLATIGASNAALPVGANRGRVNMRFGDLNNNGVFDQLGVESVDNNGGRIATIPAAFPASNDVFFATFNPGANGLPAAATPIPLLPRAPRAGPGGDVNLMAGYGDFLDPNPRAGGAGINPTRKGWQETPIDNINANRAEQVYAAGEQYNEPGDSGGPGFIRAAAALPKEAYAAGWDKRGRNLFVMTAVHAGIINPPPREPPQVGDAISWTRLDDNLATLNQTLNQLTNVKVTHNLPPDPTIVPANTKVSVLIEATFANAGASYIFYPRLFEEDDQIIGCCQFDGDLALRPTPFLDDLGGIGWGSGILPGGVSKVFAWDQTTAGALAAYAEFGNLLDPPFDDLDWLLDMNYQGAMRRDLTSVVLPVNHAAVLAAINAAVGEINGGDAIRGPFALPVPEPGTLALLLFALAIWAAPAGRR